MKVSVSSVSADVDAITAKVLECIGNEKTDVDALIKIVEPRILAALEARVPRKVEVVVTKADGKVATVKGDKHVKFEHLLRAEIVTVAEAALRVQPPQPTGIVRDAELPIGGPSDARRNSPQPDWSETMVERVADAICLASNKFRKENGASADYAKRAYEAGARAAIAAMRAQPSQPTDDVKEIVERLRARRAFGHNGATWIALTTPDPDCQAAADMLASMDGRLADSIASEQRMVDAANHEREGRAKAEARVAVLAEMLLWIDQHDPEIVAAAEGKFDIDIRSSTTEGGEK